ncbi:hypothetical protein L0F63_000040 [Massospora cicadina]|nr:hypothetical protein L0F63_000040 [Massospora cicadina]
MVAKGDFSGPYPEIEGCVVIEGNVTFRTAYENVNSVDMLREVRGNVRIMNNPSIVGFPRLEMVSGSISLDGFFIFPQDGFPQLKSVGSLIIDGVTMPNQFNFKGLNVTKSLIISYTDVAITGILSTELEELKVTYYRNPNGIQLPKLRAVEGNFTLLHGDYGTSAFPALVQVGGSLEVDNGRFPLLNKVSGSLILQGDTKLEHNTFHNLESLGSLVIHELQSPASLEFRNLNLTGTLETSFSNVGITGISSTAIRELKVHYHNNPDAIQLPQLKEIKANVFLSSIQCPCKNFLRRMFPALEHVGGSIDIDNIIPEESYYLSEHFHNPNQISLNLPVISVGKDISVQRCPSVKEIILKHLEVVNGEIYVIFNSHMDLLSIPKLKKAGSIYFADYVETINFNTEIRWDKPSYFNTKDPIFCYLYNPGEFSLKSAIDCNGLCFKSIVLTTQNFNMAMRCQIILGDLTLNDQTNLTNLSFKNLEAVYGNVIFNGFKKSVQFPNLNQIAGTLLINNSTVQNNFVRLRGLNKLDVSSLVNGILKFTNLDVKDTVSIQNTQLTQVTGISSKEITIPFPSLQVLKEVTFYENPSLNASSHIFPELKVVEGTLEYKNSGTYLHFKKLEVDPPYQGSQP